MMSLDAVYPKKRENKMNQTIESIIKYYISRLENDELTPEERERLEEILEQCMNIMIQQ